MVHLIVGGHGPPPAAPKKIEVLKERPSQNGADGKITATEYDDYCSSKGFRPGRRSGRHQEGLDADGFLEMDDQFNFKIKRQEKAFAWRVAGFRSCVSFQACSAAGLAAAGWIFIWLF